MSQAQKEEKQRNYSVQRFIPHFHTYNPTFTELKYCKPTRMILI